MKLFNHFKKTLPYWGTAVLYREHRNLPMASSAERQPRTVQKVAVLEVQ